MYTFLFLTLLISSGELLFGQKNFHSTIELIDSLKQNSIKIHDKTINKFIIVDLDNDGSFEVIERTNRIEKEALGFLPSSLAYVFNFDKIFSMTNGKYKESNNFLGYLYSRRSHYKLWLKIIENNCDIETNESEFKILQLNKEYFLLEINRLIELTEYQIFNAKK